ncbi:hypothetical protein JXB02_03580 [Candidatus Woesearchaeota archaeon]|nr:hypothetical protein [Candidatus Woesearchaeota archaeon]
MKHTYLAGITLVVMLLMLTGQSCAGTGTIGWGNSQGGNADYDYRTGSRGLMLQFIRNAPPPEIFAGDGTNFQIEVRNVGTYPSPESGSSLDGKIVVGGFDSTAFSNSIRNGDSQSLPGNILIGKSQFNPEGSYAIVSFPTSGVATVDVPQNLNYYDPWIIASACYHYTTTAGANVCIDPDPYTIQRENEVCTVRDVSLGSQGAPVAITSVEEDVMTNRILFKINIANVGGGTIVGPDYYSECPFNLRNEMIDIVDVHVSSSSLGTASCQPNNGQDLRLLNGRGVLYCYFTAPASTGPAYETPIQIDVDYVYMDSIKTRVKIFSAPASN